MHTFGSSAVMPAPLVSNSQSSAASVNKDVWPVVLLALYAFVSLDQTSLSTGQA